MRKIEWTSPALNDLTSAGEYISQDNPKPARRMASRVKEAVEHLREHPNLGRPGRLTDTKELVVSGTPLIVIYWIKSGGIQILRLLHHARRWP
ncbi:MAG: type II toxin-antitoxin system RelE/ParE family toxin [Desulfobulbaceae bacterium]|nr:type II toxin-antitoxin system RelE/ParE family toxin [Desulfobulbaceae bacterium]